MNIIDVAFHDTAADHRRVAPYRDYHSLDMAALGDKVSLCMTLQEHSVIGVVQELHSRRTQTGLRVGAAMANSSLVLM